MTSTIITPAAGDTHAIEREAYRAYLTAQLLKFGFADELADCANHVHHGVQNATPPKEIWYAMLPTVRVLERIREYFGPTSITSGYRSAPYNATYSANGAVKDSMHVRNLAIDFKCRDAQPRTVASFARDLRMQGLFTGGVGVYKSWVHIDTRGTVADWNG